MTTFLGFIAILFATKGLGGSFHSTLGALGWEPYHGAFVGLGISLLMGAFFLNFDSSRPELIKSKAPLSKFEWRVFCACFFSLVSAAIVVRIQAIETPLDLVRADNIPTLISGLDEVLSGKLPYHPRALSDGRIIPHYYLPVLWLGYLPFQALGLDVRWLNILSHLILYLLVFDLFRRSTRWIGGRFCLSALILIFCIGLHAFSKEAIRQVVDVQMAPFWIGAMLFCWAALLEKKKVVRFLTPLFLLTRESAFILLVPYAIHVWKTDRSEFWETVKISLIVGAVLCVPILIMEPKGLFLGALHYSGSADKIPWDHMTAYYGLGGYLKNLGLRSLFPILQFLGLAAAAVLVIKGVQREKAVALGALAYFPFVLFVSLTFAYLFNESLFFCYLLLFYCPSDTPVIASTKS